MNKIGGRDLRMDWDGIRCPCCSIKLRCHPRRRDGKEVKFTYEDDDSDYALNVYKKATSGYLYGTKRFDASGFTLLAGEEEIIATPFAPTLIRPATDLFDLALTIPQIYSIKVLL